MDNGYTNITTHEAMSNVLQPVYLKESTFPVVANQTLEEKLKFGDRVEVPQVRAHANMLQTTPARDTALRFGSAEDTTDTVQVTESKVATYAVSLDDMDKLGEIPASERAAEEMASVIRNYVDGIVLGETLKANYHVLDNGSGTPIAYTGAANKTTKGFMTISTSNITKVARVARDRVRRSLRATSGFTQIAVVDQDFLSIMEEKLAAQAVDFSIGVLQNGLINSAVLGFRGYVSYNLTQEVTVQVSGVATADDTLVISAGDGADQDLDNITFTAKAAPSAEGEFDVAGSASDQADAIVQVVTGVAETGVSVPYATTENADGALLKDILSDYYRVSAEKVVDGSDVYVRFYFKSGATNLDVTGLTNTAQTRKGIHQYFGMAKAISLVSLAMPKITRAGILDDNHERYNYTMRTLFGADVLSSAKDYFVSVPMSNA